MTLLSLPLELLQHIAGCLETAHRPSLQAFSLTSSACHAASLPVIFQRICITVHNHEGLRRHVDSLREALSRTDSFSCIRQITVTGALRLRDKQVEGYSTHTPWSFPYDSENVLDEDPVNYEGMYAVYDESVIERSSEEDMAWAPLVTLLGAKIPLEDLVFDCQSQFPPSLLRMLHEQHPQCRLHHLTFKFRTLLWGVPNSYEMELATSPSLYTVKVACAQRDSDGDDDFNLEAMMELVTGLAPNLNKVIVLNLFPGGSLRSTLPRGSWQSLPGFSRGKRGSLKSLSLKGHTRLKTPKMLQDWARHIDFTCLQHLTLDGCLGMMRSGLSGETMEWIVQTQSFPHVKSLSVHITRDDLNVEKPHYREHAISFFRTFESLEQLSIGGPIDYQIMDGVLAHHGQTLRKLSLHPFEEIPVGVDVRDLRDLPFHFTKDCVLQLRAQCPVLEELTILVKRNKSSASEAEIYRCFGEMTNLRALSLLLECSNWRVTRDPTYAPDFDLRDQEPVETGRYPWLKRGELKETFINCAVDEALACSIWKTISQNKTGRPLERLKLWPTGAGEYGTAARLPPTFAAIVQNLARSWLFERVPRDDTEDFTVTELRQRRRLALDEKEAKFLAHPQDFEFWKVFRSIWPSKNGSKDFRDDWSSYSL
ncbi:uncharacterized protein PFLUO_LOCUS252 [Penicillium psychrofluorescens]|uniref:uncharacterized protein n=1 Tax=Penicillium psychrofluorescens TaxID=3158075 RepID=UPI003CCD6FB6